MRTYSEIVKESQSFKRKLGYVLFIFPNLLLFVCSLGTWLFFSFGAIALFLLDIISVVEYPNNDVEFFTTWVAIYSILSLLYYYFVEDKDRRDTNFLVKTD